MIVIGIILSFLVLAWLCWLLFSLAVCALPLYAGLTTWFAAYSTGSGPIGAVIVGAIAGAITFVAGQFAFTTLRSPIIRSAVALLFAAPAPLRAITLHSASRSSPYLQRDGRRQSQLLAPLSWRQRRGYA